MRPSDQHFDDLVLMSESRDRQAPNANAEAPLFSPGDGISDRYKVVRFIARGGMGEVYEVEDLELKARIALKTISPSRASSPKQLNRFRQEIQLARKVAHPNVCRVFDLGRHKNDLHGDVLFLTMELLDGETLAAHLREHGPMSCEQAAPLIRQMVSALSAAHQLGIVHRDFKPGNVMLVSAGPTLLVKVTDFGLATTPESEDTVSASGGDIVGTPAYMAPEQFRGQCSTRTDVYALAVTVFQMVTGKLPASFEVPFEGMGSDTSKRINAHWQTAITKSLAMNPASRFDSVEDFWRALSGESVGGFGWKTVVSGIKRHRALSAVAAFLVLVAITLLGFGVIPNPFKTLPTQKHIAVLPFRNIGNDASNQAFADGVAESLTSKLSQLERYQKSFWVVPSTDTRNVQSLDEANRNLKATLVVTGSIQHTSNGVDFTANLIDATNHRQLASRTIHVNSSNLDDMQQSVWESVADMLDLQISAQVKQELAAGGTTKSGAYELYEQGHGFVQRYDLDDVEHAIDLYNKALAKDPQYALAYAGLGDAYATKYFLTKDPQWIAEATRNAGRAVELNNKLIPVRVTLARVYQQTGQLDKALAEYQRAIDEDPAAIDAALQIGEVYAQQGKYPEAEAAYKKLISRRPEYWAGYGGLGELYYNNGHFAKAAAQFQSVIDLAPDNSFGYHNLGGAYIAMGRYEDAIDVLKKGLSIKPRGDDWANLGAAYMYVGRYEEAAEAMKKATVLSPHNHVIWRNLADSYHQIPSRMTDAKLAYEKALETANDQLTINPNDVEALSGIGLYEAHLGHSDEAQEYIKRALELSPRNSDALFTSALVYEIIGHRDQALRAVDEAVTAGYSIEEVQKEPELLALRSDPRYQRWLQNRVDKGKLSPT